MGHRWSKFSGGRSAGDSDLELLRERVLDHPDEEEAVSGHDIENNSSTGPIKVIVKQDGIGRTGGIVLGIVAGLGFGLGLVTLTTTTRDYRELEREVRLQQLKLDEYRVALLNAHIEPNPHVEGEQK